MKRTKTPRFFFNHAYLNVRKNRKKRFEMTNKIIESGVYLFGKQNQLLEKNLLKFLKKGSIATVGSGHDAIFLALCALHLSPTDEILFPVNSYPTAFPVCMASGKAIPVDVDENGQISFSDVIKKITPYTKAIILVYLYGLVGEIEKIIQYCKKRKIIVIEDCAQSFGGYYNGEPLGTLGDISCFSFYPTKNLATLGDGGALWTHHKKYYEFFLKARSYGESKRYYSTFLAGHSRLPEIQAGILNLYFKSINHEFTRRRKVANYYRNQFKKAHLEKYITVLSTHEKSNPVEHLFVIKTKKRNALKKYLKNHHIETVIHYPHPIHILPAFAHLGYKKGDFPMAENLARQILSLPFHQSLTQKDINYIVLLLKTFYSRKKREKHQLLNYNSRKYIKHAVQKTV